MDKIKDFFKKLGNFFRGISAKIAAIPEKTKKIINITVTCLQVAIVLLAVTASIIILVNPTASGVNGKGTVLLPVLTDSMSGTEAFYEQNPEWTGFESGDLVVAHTPKDGSKKWDAENLDVGDIVTFEMNIGGNTELNTHRIVEKGENALGVYYYTQGDANNSRELVYASEVKAIYKSQLSGVGATIMKLQEPTTFLLAIVLPLIVLFIYNIILFVHMLMQSKLEKAALAKAETAVDEEEIKRKAIEDYLAKQNSGAEPKTDKSDDEIKD